MTVFFSLLGVVLKDFAADVWKLAQTPNGRTLLALAVGLLIAAGIGWKLHEARGTIALLNVTNSALTANNATLKANQQDLRDGLNKQSGSIKGIGKTATAAAAASSKAAAAVLAADALRKRDAAIKGVGPDVMNQWLTETFSDAH